MRSLLRALCPTLIVLALFAGCEDGSPVDPGPEPNMGPEGGTLLLADGAVTLTVPAGAVAEPVRITAAPVADPVGRPGFVSGTAYELGPDGLEFAETVVLSIRYDPAAIPDHAVGSSLTLAEVVDGEPRRVRPSDVDAVARVVSGAIDGFSQFRIHYGEVELDVSNASTGEDIPEEYPVALTVGTQPAAEEHVLAANASITLRAPTDEPFAIDLDVPGHCDLLAAEPTTDTSGATVAVAFDVDCGAPLLAAVLMRGLDQDRRFSLALVDSAGGSVETIYESDRHLSAPAFGRDPTGEVTVYFGEGGQLFRATLDGEVDSVAAGGVQGPQVVPNWPMIGSHRLLASLNTNIVSWDLSGGAASDHLTDADHDFSPVPFAGGLLTNRVPAGSGDFTRATTWFHTLTPELAPASSMPSPPEGPLMSVEVRTDDRPAPAPDGTVILSVFTSASGGPGTHISAVRPQAGVASRVTAGPNEELSPSVRHDGLLAFVRHDGGTNDIYTVDLDGSGLSRVTDVAPATVLQLAWRSPFTDRAKPTFRVEP